MVAMSVDAFVSEKSFDPLVRWKRVDHRCAPRTEKRCQLSYEFWGIHATCMRRHCPHLGNPLFSCR